MTKPSQTTIDQFLAVKRLAVIGVSRRSVQYSRMLFRELLKQGYDAIPVNPSADQIDGRPCHKSVKDISPIPQRAVIILPKEKTEQALIDCADVGIRDVWLLPIGNCDDRFFAQAQQRQINLIAGVCLFMFLPHAAVIHRLHGSLLKLFHAYPK
jgi:predicted CoA-binding protein